MPFCPNCGKEVVEGNAFCPNCGKPIAPAQPNQAAQQNTQAQPQPNGAYQANAQQDYQPQPNVQPEQSYQNAQYQHNQNAQYQTPPQYQSNAQNTAQQAFDNFTNTPDSTNQFDPQDIQANKIISLFSYLGLLFLIPLLARPNSKYARFHANQGIVLLIIELAYSIVWGIISAVCTGIGYFAPALGWLFSIIFILLNLGNIFFVVLTIIGIVNACTGKAKELPLIGKIKILK